jgi:hypothetical protein
MASGNGYRRNGSLAGGAENIFHLSNRNHGESSMAFCVWQWP